MACVRIQVRYNVQGGSYQAYTASGVLIDGGRRVLTAGHALPDDPGHEIEVTLADGRSFAARRLGARYEVFATGDEDWGVLEVDAPAGVQLPSLELAKPTAGSLAYVLGYPSDLGIAPGGRIAPGLAHARAPLDPLLFVGRVQGLGPIDLSPVAGCVPLGGASGAPVVNEEGRLLGVFVSVSQSSQSEGVVHSYQVARVDAVQGLAALLQRSGT